MECEFVIQQLLDHSILNLLEAIDSLTKKSYSRLEAGFVSQDMPQYCRELTLLNNLFTCALEKYHTKDVKELIHIAANVVDKVCFGLLVNVCPTTDSRKEVLVFLGSVCKLVAVCVQVHADILSKVLANVQDNIGQFLKVNSSDDDDHSCNNAFDIHTALEILRHVLGHKGLTTDDVLKAQLTQLFHKLSCVVSFISIELIGTTGIPVLLKLLELDKDHASENLQELWSCIQNFSQLGQDENRHYVLLCGMANWFFPTSGVGCRSSEIVKDERLWKTLQQGLLNRNTLTRKRSLYLVKRIVDICQLTGADVTTGSPYPVFWWTKLWENDLSKIWEDFMLLAEVLEEKQVHVIKPLLPRMKSLIKSSTVNSNGVAPLLHTSWLTTILIRCSRHESLQIIHWSAATTLSLDLRTCPLLLQGQQKYLTAQLLQTLRETKLFNREPGSPSGCVPVLAEKFVTFLQTCWQSLTVEQRGAFFCETVQSISHSTWGPIPLLYVCRGLSLVPCSPCLDRETIGSLRKLLTGDLVTAESYLRGAITGFIVQLVINLTDKVRVSLGEAMQLLMLAHQEDCLQRGTTLWDQCVQWLKEDPGGDNCDWSHDAIRKHVEACVSKYLEVTMDSKFSSADAVSAHAIARLLLLASDASIVTNTASADTDVLIGVIEKLVVILNSINSHSYMSNHKADKAAQLLVLTVRELVPKNCDQSDSVAKVILSAVEDCQTELLIYVSRQITASVKTLFDRSLLTLYTECVEMLIEVADLMKGADLERLTEICIAVLNRKVNSKEITLHTRMQQLSAMSVLGRICDFLSRDLQLGSGSRGSPALCQMVTGFLKGWKVVTHFGKPSAESDVSHKEWGNVTSLYLQRQWQVLLLGLQCSAAPWCPVKELLVLATDTLAVGLEETSISVMQCLKLLIQKAVLEGVVTDEELVTVIDSCWSSLQEARRSHIQWSVLEGFVQVTFQACLMQKDEDSLVLRRLRQCASSLLQYCSEKTGVVNILTSRLASVWTQPAIEHAAKFAPIIVELCKFGGQPTRGQRQLYDVSATVEALGDQCAVNSLMKGITNGDLLVRAITIDFLCTFDQGNATHRCLATELVRLCSRSYVDVLQGSSNKSANSLVHRQRHRLIQTVLLLESFVTEDYVAELWKFLWSSLEQECQPSIRHVLEWIVIATMARYPKFGKELWVLFDHYRGSKNIVLCSLLCVVIHLGPHVPPDQQEEYYSHAFPCVLPWCMAHHFATRIFAQATLCKLWNQCHELQLHSVIAGNRVLQSLVDFSQENRNSTTNVKKLLDSFFYSSLDFKKDFTLEIIYHILPAMTDIAEEDWIRPEVFVQVNPAWSEGHRSSFTCLRRPTDHQKEFEFGKWRYTTLRIIEDGQGEDVTSEGTGDVQKKIMPWKQMTPDLETTEEIDHGIKLHKEEGLVVVTSLISKLPNLGGLCRTSEIFGVSEYVLGRLKYTEDKAFQGLSVTAHKWVPITEVAEQKLPDYLQEKRQEGYTLVGVEQTANSVCLSDYTFPEKTLLLLGNEKEGIPVDLISLLDVCVEIPQQGVVRSLNVHVSGALLIWEYRRQQLIRALDSSS